MGNKKNKNVSQSIKNGSILNTRDEYLQRSNKYSKPGYENKGNYRKVAVIDSNRNDHLAIVKLRSNGTALPDSKSCYKPFVETLDDTNRPIRVGGKFIPTGKRLSNYSVSAIKQDCFTSENVKQKNIKKVRWLKGRK